MIGIQYRTDAPEHLEEEFIKFPLLPVGAVPVCRRIQDYAIVEMAALDFAAHELHGVLHDPAYSVHAAVLHILPRPGDHLPDRIQMGDVGSGRLGRKRSPSGIGEEVQHLGILHTAGPGRNPLPIGGLLREYAHMLECGKSQAHTKFEAFARIAHLPLVGHSLQLLPRA